MSHAQASKVTPSAVICCRSSRWELEKDFGELLALAPWYSTLAMAWHDPEELEKQIDRIARKVASQPDLLHRVERFLDGWKAAGPADRRWSVQAWRRGAARVVETLYTPPPDWHRAVALEDWVGWPRPGPTTRAPRRFSHVFS